MSSARSIRSRNMRKNKALVMTSDPPLCREITDSLQAAALEIDHAETYAQAVSLYARSRFVLVILDLGIPNAAGVAIGRRLRQLEQTPILALSAFGSRKEAISALTAEADAYLPMEGPLDQETLLAYASVLMRRYLSANTKETALIQVTEFGLKINLGTRKAFLNGENLHLTPKQYDILQLLVDRIGEIVTKEELFESAWKAEYDICADEPLKYHIREIRRKLGQHGMDRLIETTWGVGHQISLEENS